jgi:hypothetical protein
MKYMLKKVCGVVTLMGVSFAWTMIHSVHWMTQTQGTQTQNISMVQDAEFIQAVWRMFWHTMTMYNQPDLFRPTDLVTRQEAAKFFVQFATLIWGVDSATDVCVARDIQESDPTLRMSLLDACKRWIMKWYKGNIYPTQVLSKAEWMTMLLRILSWWKDESMTPWRLWYYREARVVWLTKELDAWDLDRPMTRYEIALLLYRAGNVWNSIEENEREEIKNILLDLGILIN